MQALADTRNNNKKAPQIFKEIEAVATVFSLKQGNVEIFCGKNF